MIRPNCINGWIKTLGAGNRFLSDMERDFLNTLLYTVDLESKLADLETVDQLSKDVTEEANRQLDLALTEDAEEASHPPKSVKPKPKFKKVDSKQ